MPNTCWIVIPNGRVFHRGGGISVLTAVERQPKEHVLGGFHRFRSGIRL
jgi:hypothetical protein